MYLHTNVFSLGVHFIVSIAPWGFIAIFSITWQESIGSMNEEDEDLDSMPGDEEGLEGPLWTRSIKTLMPHSCLLWMVLQ